MKPTNNTFSANTLNEWLHHLEQLHPSEIELGLTRITQVGERLNLINFQAKVITVAGTNGKGTTCAFLEKMLVDAGHKVGVYSSPHIQQYNERLRINHHQLPDHTHCHAFSIIEAARGEISLSYFEYATLACLYILQQQNCDYILLEVGLGGRLDATNMVESDVSVITTIGIDHVDWLGDDREVIGFEKAGVFRANKPAICGELVPPASIMKHAQDIGANLELVNHGFHFAVLNDQQWQWQGKRHIGPINQTLMPIQNACTALAVIEALQIEIEPAQLIKSIETAQLAGRLQSLPGYPCELYIDVAHNPQSAEYLASQLQRLKINHADDCHVYAIVGMLSDKDISATLTAVNDQIDEYHFVTLDCYRGAKSHELLSAYQSIQGQQHNVSCFENVDCALDKVVKKVTASDIIIVFGSFFTVSDILDKLQG